MFETDFPYSTSISPEPASFARNQRETISGALAGVDEVVVRKIFCQKRSSGAWLLRAGDA